MGRVAGVNPFHAATKFFGFVSEESRQLRERPGVKPSLGFAPARLHPLPNVRQVLNHDDGSRCDAVEDALRENMIAVASEALFTPRKTPQVPFGAFGAFRLKFPFETETPFADFAPAFLSMKSAIGSDSRTGDAQVNTKRLPIIRELHIVHFENNVERELVLAEHKIGSCHFTIHRIGRVVGQAERQEHSACDGRQIDDAFMPIKDFVLLGTAVWSAGEALLAAQQAEMTP